MSTSEKAGSAWAPLRIGIFRALWLAALVSNIGTWMQTVGAQWLLVPQASRLFDEQVNLRDEGTREEIRQVVEAVAHWCRRVQPEESGGADLATSAPRQ